MSFAFHVPMSAGRISGRMAFVMTFSAGGLFGGVLQALLTGRWSHIAADSTWLIGHAVLGVPLGWSVAVAIVIDRRPAVCAPLAALLTVGSLLTLSTMLPHADAWEADWRPGGSDGAYWAFSAAVWAASLATFHSLSRVECRHWTGIVIEFGLICSVMFLHTVWMEPRDIAGWMLLPRGSDSLNHVWLRWPYAAGMWVTVWIVRLYALRCVPRRTSGALAH